MRALDKILSDISDYDMTQPNEGLKLMGDILTDMALGHLVSAIPGAVRKLTGKGFENVEKAAAKSAPPAIGIPEAESATGRGGSAVADSTGSATQKASVTETGPSEPLGNSSTGTSSPSNPGQTADDLEQLLGGNWSPEHTSWSNPPPGIEVPEYVRSTPRPVYPQEQPYSCAIACVKMVAGTVNRTSLPESWLRSVSHGDVQRWFRTGSGYHPGRGTFPENIKPLLDLAKVPNSGIRSATVDELAAATGTGYPAIVGVNRGGAGHAMIVDAVVGSPGSRFLVVRDPLNLAHMTVRDRQFLRLTGFSNDAIIPESVFLNSYQGRAIFTHP